MAAAKMRHFNSPEEVARREGAPPGVSRSKDFKHYNHPDEVAKRAAQGKPSSVVAPPRRPRAPAPSLAAWPPAGEPNNAPADPPVVVAVGEVVPNEKPDTVPPPAGTNSNVARLRRLEALVHTFLEDEAEARHFRMLLNNVHAITEGQQDLINRVRSLELTIDQLLEQLNADEADDDEPLEPLADDPHPEVAPPPPEPVTVNLGPVPASTEETTKPEDS
jgi:hypothetical protein